MLGTLADISFAILIIFVIASATLASTHDADTIKSKIISRNTPKHNKIAWFS